MIGKKVIYQNRNKGQLYSIVHCERLIELEQESEEIFATQDDKVEMFKKELEKYLSRRWIVK